MRPVSRPLVLCAALALTSLTTAASAGDDVAKVRDTGTGDLTYEFFDDPLAADGIAPGGGAIRVVHRQIRTLLIRPRTQFVTQMLKSVEDL